MIDTELRRGKFLVFQYWRFDQLEQGVAEQIRVGTIVKPECHFIEVGGEVLRRDFMPRTDDATLEQRERGFDAVRSDIPVHIHPLRMVNRHVGNVIQASLDESRGVGWELVRHNHIHVATQVLFDVSRQRTALRILRLEEPQFAATLLDADNASLMVAATLILLAASLPADICLIHLHDAVQRLRINFLHRRPNPVAEVPCRLVGDAEGPFKLVGAHALLGFAEQVDTQKPLPQREMGVVEDGASRHGKLIAASITVILVALHDPRNLVRFAARAHNAISPAKRLKVSAALVLRAKFFDQGAKINGVCHD